MSFKNLWKRVRPSDSTEIAPPTGEVLPDPAHLTNIAELERALDGWTRHWAPGEREQPDAQLSAMSRRAETELRTFFGQDALQLVRSTAGQPGKGPLLLAADRLFVNFLGRRAAMAVTRKLYSARL
jgi:hypothetical protein